MSPGSAILALRGPARPAAPAWPAGPVAVAAVGLGLLAVALVAGIAAGTVAIPPGETLGILGRRLLGLDIAATWPAAAETIVIDLRLPACPHRDGRRAAAWPSPARRSRASSATRSRTRTCSGTASGAALGASLAVLIPVRILVLEFGLLHGLAFLGALGAVLVVYQLSQAGAGSPMTSLLLTGYAVSSLLAAGLAMAMYLSGAGLRQIFAYLLGGFDASSWGRLAVAAPLIALASLGILLRARSLNGMLLGEDAASHLGVDVRRERAILLGARLAGHGGRGRRFRPHRVRGARRAPRRPADRRAPTRGSCCPSPRSSGPA